MAGRAGILILAGGEATRLPGKLSLSLAPDTGARAAPPLPMIVSVYRNVRGDDARRPAREIVMAGKATFAAEIDALLPIPLVIDRRPGRGPLGGMLAAFAWMRSPFVFAVAGDAPFVDAAFVDRIDRVRRDVAGFEAFVPVRADGGIEPLAALYDRLAFLREGALVLRSGRGSLRAVIDRLRTKFVPIDDERLFTNVNTPTDYAALRARLAGEIT